MLVIRVVRVLILNIYDDIGRAYWQTEEEADPVMLFYEGHIYLTYKR